MVSWSHSGAGATAAVRWNLRDLREYNRQPTDSEVAEALEISAEQWQEIKLAWVNRAPA